MTPEGITSLEGEATEEDIDEHGFSKVETTVDEEEAANETTVDVDIGRLDERESSGRTSCGSSLASDEEYFLMRLVTNDCDDREGDGVEDTFDTLESLGSGGVVIFFLLLFLILFF